MHKTSILLRVMLILFAALLIMPFFSFSHTNSISHTEKSAEEFIRLLESYDYWFRSSTPEDPTNPLNDLESLSKKNPELLKLEKYDLYEMDYGRRKKHGNSHNFTVLELNFKKKYDIPFANEENIQIYPNSKKRKIQANQFPLLKYYHLNHDIGFELQDYIDWKAI